jgi:hypothetical protein
MHPSIDVVGHLTSCSPLRPPAALGLTHVPEQSTPEQRALACVDCADTRSRLYGKRRQSKASIVNQHWRGHIPSAINQQLLNAVIGTGAAFGAAGVLKSLSPALCRICAGRLIGIRRRAVRWDTA